MFATEGVPWGRPAAPPEPSRRLPVGRIHSGRPPSVYHQTPPDDVCNGGGSTGEACLPPCTFTQVARRPDSFRPSPKRVPPDASRRCLQRRGFHGGGLPPPVHFHAQVARRPDSFRPSPKRVPPDASRRC